MGRLRVSDVEVENYGDGLADLGQHGGPDVAAGGGDSPRGDGSEVLALRRRCDCETVGCVRFDGDLGVEPGMVEVRGTTWMTDGLAFSIRWAVTTTAG